MTTLFFVSSMRHLWLRCSILWNSIFVFSSPRYHDFIWLRISSIPIMTASSLRKSSTFVAESSHVLLPVLTLFRLSIRSFPFEVLSRMELDWSVLMREDSFAGEFSDFFRRPSVCGLQFYTPASRRRGFNELRERLRFFIIVSFCCITKVLPFSA